MLLQVILEGIGLGVLLILVCAIGIRKGALQPGSSEQVYNAGTYNTRKNQAKRPAVQSHLRSRLHCLCAGLRLCGERRKGLRSGLLAAAGHTVRYESHRPILG